MTAIGMNSMVDWDKIEHEPNKETKVLNSFLIDLKAKIQQQKDEVTNVNTELEKAAVENKNLDENLKKSEERNEGFEKKIDDLEKKIEELEAVGKEAEVLKDKLQTAESTIEELKASIEDLKNTISDKENEFQKMTDACHEEELKVSALQGEIEGMKAALESTGEQKDTELKEAFNERDQMRSDYESQLHDANVKIRDLETEIAKLNEHLSHEQANVAQRDEDIKTAESEKADLAQQISDLKSQMKQKERMLSEKDYTYFKKMRETQAGKTDSE
jgi:chromosome segregation protein